MSKLRSFFAVLAAVTLLATPAHGSVIDWVLQGVLFNDGGTAYGTFSSSADTGFVSALDITTTAGNLEFSSHYSTSDLTTTTGLPDGGFGFCFPPFPCHIVRYHRYGFEAIHPADYGGYTDLFIDFRAPFTEPGFIPILLSMAGDAGTQHYESLSIRRSYEEYQPSSPHLTRYIVAGGAFGSVGSTSAIPEPATLALVGLGLAGLCFSRRKQ